MVAQVHLTTQFMNKSRGDVYSLSHDENLVIDCDYFVMSNTLDPKCGVAKATS